jgi:hypothetical protein
MHLETEINFWPSWCYFPSLEWNNSAKIQNSNGFFYSVLGEHVSTWFGLMDARMCPLGFFLWPPPSFHSSSVIYICMQYVLTIHFWGGRAGPPGLSIEQNIPLCMSSTVHTPPASFSPFLSPESLSTGPLGPLGRSRATFHYPSLPAQLHPRGRAVFLMLSPSSHPLSHLRSQLPRIQLGSVEDPPSLPFAPSQGTGTTLSQKQRIFPRNARSVYGNKSSGR